MEPLRWGAERLVRCFGERVGRVLEHAIALDHKQVLKRVRAAAEMAIQQQSKSLDTIVMHVDNMVSLGQWKALLYLEHVCYDETTLDIRVQYEMHDEPLRQVSRIHVVDPGYALIIERLPLSFEEGDREEKHKFAIIQGRLGVGVRSTDNATGEAIRSVLDSVAKPTTNLTKIFRYCLRLAESDECGSNLRAESLLLHSRQQKGEEWLSGHIFCLAHKLHSSAVKSWALQARAVTGVIHSCKQLHQPGNMIAVNEAVAALLDTRFSVRYGPVVLSQVAQSFREHLIYYFSPPRQQVRRRAAWQACLEFFNSDLLAPEVVHVCVGPTCCESESVSLVKGKRLLQHLLRLSRPTMFSRSNWVTWTATLRWFGFATSFHQGLVVQAFHHGLGHGRGSRAVVKAAELTAAEACFSILHEDGLGSASLIEQQTLEEGEDERVRQENAKSLTTALEFLRPGSLEVTQHIWLLRVPLEAERVLMAHLTHSISAAREESEWRSTAIETSGLCSFMKAASCEDFMTPSCSSLEMILWAPLLQTELLSKQTSSRSASGMQGLCTRQ